MDPAVGAGSADSDPADSLPGARLYVSKALTSSGDFDPAWDWNGKSSFDGQLNVERPFVIRVVAVLDDRQADDASLFRYYGCRGSSSEDGFPDPQ